MTSGGLSHKRLKVPHPSSSEPRSLLPVSPNPTAVPSSSPFELSKLMIRFCAELNSMVEGRHADRSFLYRCHRVYDHFKAEIRVTAPVFVPAGQKDKPTLDRIQSIATAAQSLFPIPRAPDPAPVLATPRQYTSTQSSKTGLKKKKGQAYAKSYVAPPPPPRLPSPPPPPPPILPPMELIPPPLTGKVCGDSRSKLLIRQTVDVPISQRLLLRNMGLQMILSRKGSL